MAPSPSAATHAARPATPALLSGSWVNQLGSALDIIADDHGRITGTYRATGGALAGVPRSVEGSCDTGSGERDLAMGFSVVWHELHSATSWCGRYDALDDVLRLSWLSTMHTDPAERWKSTLVGQDVFSRSAAAAG